MTQLDRTLKRKVSLTCTQLVLVAQLNSSVRLPLLDLEGCFRGLMFIDFNM